MVDKRNGYYLRKPVNFSHAKHTKSKGKNPLVISNKSNNRKHVIKASLFTVVEDKIDEPLILEFLLNNSELAKNLEDVVLKELLAHIGNYIKCIKLLSRLPQLYNDEFNPINILLYSKFPYDSLCGMSEKDLNKLLELCRYLLLPRLLEEKINSVIIGGTNLSKYDWKLISPKYEKIHPKEYIFRVRNIPIYQSYILFLEESWMRFVSFDIFE